MRDEELIKRATEHLRNYKSRFKIAFDLLEDLRMIEDDLHEGARGIYGDYDEITIDFKGYHLLLEGYGSTVYSDGIELTHKISFHDIFDGWEDWKGNHINRKNDAMSQRNAKKEKEQNEKKILKLKSDRREYERLKKQFN